MNRYTAREKRSADFKWRSAKKSKFQSLTVLADGFAVAFGFFTLMSAVRGEEFLLIGLLALATATALLTGFTLNEQSLRYFASDRARRVID